MADFELARTWMGPPDDGEAFGPERSTWARIGLTLSGSCLTSHFLPGEKHANRDVVGAASGLAEWIVDNWVHLLWEIHTPFPKVTGDSSRVPTLRDVRNGEVRDVAYAPFAAWYHRHTLGHGESDLALPLVQFLPEDKVVGVVAHAPPSHLDGAIRFVVQSSKEPVWLAKDAVASTLRGFVEDTIQRAEQSPETAPWAKWLGTRFDASQVLADSEDARREQMFGELVAREWKRLSKDLGDQVHALSGVLTDSALLTDSGLLNALAEAVRSVAGGAASLEWKTLRAEPGERMLPPFQRGYRLAERVRRDLGLGREPLWDIRGVLSRFGVDVQELSAPGLFRSACVVSESGKAVVYHSRSDLYRGVAPTRFAVAAALGRLLSDGPTISGSYGCAHGHQSRWQKTQEANAFAAEFLLPKEALQTVADIEVLAESYGISRTAAERHRQNRLNN